MSTIVLLNGTSSAGKTTLAKALQSSFDVPYLIAGLDQYLHMLPDHYINPPLWSEIYHYGHEGDAIISVETGPLGEQLIRAMHRSVAALANAGFNVILDHTILDGSWIDDMVRLYADHTVYFVGVHCPLDVLEQRERQRHDHTTGQARAQFDVVHTGHTYDTEVDTSMGTPDAIMHQVKAFMLTHPKPTAFTSMQLL